jgi:class 3 adenylate cyclase
VQHLVVNFLDRCAATCPSQVGDALVAALRASATTDAAERLASLRDRGEQTVRGRGEPVRIWTWADSR